MLDLLLRMHGSVAACKARAHMFARIRAYLSTARKNKRDVFQEIVAVFLGQPFMPSIAA